MSRQTTRALATGLLISAILLLGYEHFFKEDTPAPNPDSLVNAVATEDVEQLEQEVQYWKK